MSISSSPSCTPRSALMVGLTLVGLAVLDWRLALAGLAAGPVQALALRWYLRKAGPMYAAERVAEGARAQQLLASIEGAATVRAFRLAATHTARIAARSREAVAIALHTTVQQTRFFGALNIAELIGTSAVLVVGFALVGAGTITIGAATAAALYFIRLFDPINTLLGTVDDAQEAGAGLARLVGVTLLRGPDRARRTAEPAVGACIPAISLATVVLPAPLAPTRATRSPAVDLLGDQRDRRSSAGSAGARVLESSARRALEGRTALVVAHRLTQAAAADRIVVLDAGRVVEVGRHTELATGDGPYSRLWAAWSGVRPRR